MNKEDYKQTGKMVLTFLQNKKVQWALVAILFLVTLCIGTSIRLSVLPNLIDSTTGDYTPLALDPYYFLRISETLVANEGVLPEIDNMRYQALDSGWSKEILPQSTVIIYNIMKIFNSEITLNFVNVLNPVIFFVLGLIVFFVLLWLLTKNKWLALVSSFILAIIPPYLYRTMAGFSDHESIGMFGFFLALLFFVMGMLYLEKKKNKKLFCSILGGLSGITTMFAIASWGGIGKFLFMILPLAFLIRWFTKKNRNGRSYISFYILFIFGIFSAPIFGYSISYIVKRYMLSSTGILTIFSLAYIIVETLIEKNKTIPKFFKKYTVTVSIFFVMIVGGIFYQIFVGDFFSIIGNIISRIIYPFGTGRVNLTVAENKQPYLMDLISQVGKVVFYTFLFGCFIVGNKISKGIKEKKYKLIFTGSFAFFIFGILFSRISANSLLNGTNFISKALFFVSFLTLAVSSIYIYRKSDWEIETKWIFIAAWMIPMLLAIRSAVRVFFAIVPFISFIVPLVIFEIGIFAKKSKEDLKKLIGWSLLILLTIGLISSSFGYYKSAKYQAENQYPSYNSDWQKAMNWTRKNTLEGSVFLHWWDYGYWVQTGGNRPTVTDGGHFNGYWDHLIGRYVLTTPYPETAKSFMLAHNVSYLLIDPTDIGKYKAYSSIGTGKDSDDRTSWIITMTSNPSEIQETRNGTIRMYRGGTMLDDDLIYEQDGKTIFLPKGKAGIGAIIIESKKIQMGNQSYYLSEQPIGIYVYNNNQYRLPIRYLYQNGNLRDFGIGINATAYIYANVYNSKLGQQFDQTGSAMYLSEKTKDSLVAKLYLMNDPDNEYEELELVHEEATYPFAFNYGGYRGPIKIYKVNKEKMTNIIAREEFTSISGEYGEFDNLQFVK